MIATNTATAAADMLPQQIPLEALKLWRIASTDVARFTLAGVLFERQADGSTIAVATDGHRLVAVPCPEMQLPETVEPVLVPAATLRKLEAIGRKRGAVILLESIDERRDDTPGEHAARYTFRDVRGGESYTVERIPGQFPDWRKVVPTGDGYTVRVGLNARYLAEIAATIGAGNYPDTLELWIQLDTGEDGGLRGTLSPVKLYSGGGADGVIALVMPTRL